MPVDDGENVGNLRQVMRDILETTKAELFTMDMFPPLKECLALLQTSPGRHGRRKDSQ